MTSQPEYVKRSDLIDQLVLDRSTMEELGRVEVLWSYPKVHRVFGFICKSGFLDRRKTAFNLDQIDRLGTNGVLVNSAPVETDQERVQQIQTLIGSEVWTDEGNRIGRITDFIFDLKTGNIQQYLLASSGLRGLAGTVYSLYPSQILSLGSTRVMVSAAIADDLDLYQPGLDEKLGQKLKQTKEILSEELKQTKEMLSEEKQQVGQGLQSLVQKAKSVTSTVKAQVKERAQNLIEEVSSLDLDLDLDFDDRIDDRSREPEDVDFDFDAWAEEDQKRTRSPQARSASNSPQSPRPAQPRTESPRTPFVAPPRSTPSQPDARSDFTAKPRSSEAANREFTAKPQPSSEFTARPRPSQPPPDEFSAKPQPNPSAKSQPKPPRDRDVWDDEDWV